MLFSLNNSFDNSIKYININNTLPFTDFNLQIGRNINIDNPDLYKSDVIVLACSIFGTGGGSNSLYAQIGWYEL